MNNINNLAIIILAAGKGSRMLSEKAKVLHELNDISLIEYLIKTSLQLSPSKFIIVTGHQAHEVEKKASTAYLKHKINSNSSNNLQFVWQKEQLGTGHAVNTTAKALKNHNGPIIIMPGDAPLIKSETLKYFLNKHLKSKANLSVLTTIIKNAKNYGRIIRNKENYLEKIVEAKDATIEQLKINEINSGFYIAQAQELFSFLSDLKTNNKQNEYYLTDIVTAYNHKNYKVQAVCVQDYWQLEGINTKEELLTLENLNKEKLNKEKISQEEKT